MLVSCQDRKGCKQLVKKRKNISDNKRKSNFTFIRPSGERAKQLFASCHRSIWKSEVCSPTAAFMEFVKIMFVKLHSDKSLRADKATRPYFKEEKNLIEIPDYLVSFSVRWIEQLEANNVSNPIDVLFQELRNDLEKQVQLRKKKRIFEKDEHINLRPHTIKDIVGKLEHYDLFSIDDDLNGRLFETFLSATMRGRELGQFFTPRSVVKMMVLLADLRVDREHQDRVLDACCGTGGFLIEALANMRNQVQGNKSLSALEKENLMRIIADECLYGIDYGKDPPLARIARINMYLHGDGGSRIYYADALDKDLAAAKGEDPENVQNIDELRSVMKEGYFDVVLTNPPFSMIRELKNEPDQRILQQYEIAKKGTLLRPSLRSSIMFLERYCDLLRPGGKLITVIDDTVLASASFRYVRDFIRNRFLIRAIISLPGNAFRRQGSRVKTSVLVLEKKAGIGSDQPGCFYYFSEWLGVDDLAPRAAEHDIKEARSRSTEEIQQIVAGYRRYLEGKSEEFEFLPAERLTDRLDLKFCVPCVGRLVPEWRDRGIAVKPLGDCVSLNEDIVVPGEYAEQEFALLKVSYEGKCLIDKVKKGGAIKAPVLYRVKPGQIVFSIIRATDGAIGVVPEELDGAVVSESYYVFKCDTLQDAAYLWAVLRSHEIRADMQSLSFGSGRYTTYWPNVKQVLIPWLSDEERRNIGQKILEVWKMEQLANSAIKDALSKIGALGVESEESVKRWKTSKAPT
jgi:type I restriction enzyme M protein